MRVDHCKVAVEAVDGVSDEGARVRADHLSAGGVEDDDPGEVAFVRDSQHACRESLDSGPVWAHEPTLDEMKHALIWVSTLLRRHV